MDEGFGISQTSVGRTTPAPQSRPPQSRPPGYSSPPSRGYLALIIVGIIILLVGGIIWFSFGFLDTGEDDGNSVSSMYGGDKEYRDNRRMITTIGNIVEYIGVILLSVGLTIGAINDKSLPANTRLGMLIAMGLIVGFKIGGYFSIVNYG